MKTKNSVIIFAFFIFLSCDCNYKSEIIKSTVTDSVIFIKDIPPAYTKPRNKEYKTLFLLLIGEDIKQLNLENLENGFDSLCIRIWLGPSMSYKHYVLSIQRKNDSWTGQLITISRSHYGENEEKPEDTKQVRLVTPKSGWDIFIKNLLSYQVTTLPDQEKLKGYNGCGGDGLPFYFEVSTKHQYRFYTYCNIESNIQNFPEARNVNDIGRLVESEFNFTFSK